MVTAIFLSAVIAVLIYRLGFYDGQCAKKGEKLKGVIKKQKNDEDERFKRGIKNILDYKMGE